MMLPARIRVGNDNAFMHRLIDYRVTNHWYFDGARSVVILMAALMLAWNFKYISRRLHRIDLIRCVAWSFVALLIALQQSDGIGQPLLVWNLPLSAVVVVLSCTLQYERLRSVNGQGLLIGRDD